MDIKIEVNDYLLAWYLLYGATLSSEIEKFKKQLFTKYKKEYNFCYKDRNEIVKYGKDFIPDNDILYNAVLDSVLFKTIKKETMKHKLHVEKLLENNYKDLKGYISEVLKITFPKELNIYIVHPRFELMDYLKDYHSLIWGSDKDKHAALTSMLMAFSKGYLKKEYKEPNSKEIFLAILELAILNEIGKRIDKTSSYETGDASLKLIKKQIYPYWIMYLGYVEKNDLLNKMIDDKIGYDLDKYLIDRSLKKLNIEQFIEFCIKNSTKILSLKNIKNIDDDIELL